MRRSQAVTLTVVATMGIAARAQAEDPCDAASFNTKVCRAAIRFQGYCAQGMWVPMMYPQKYPYYYDQYRDLMANGGVVTPAPIDKCRRPGVGHGGFGYLGAIYAAHS